MGYSRKSYLGPDPRIVWGSVLLCALLILLLSAYYINKAYTVTEVSVTGNKHYTVEQIEEMVTQGRLGHNSIYLSMKYRNKSDLNIPFIETMDVEILSPSSIAVTVYEKAIAGCVEYLDRYMYFDKDGVVVETSSRRAQDLPYITGLKFDHVVLYEKLSVGDENIFREILSLTQLLSKYSIETDQIHFDSDKQITLYFGQAKVRLGTMDSIDEKMQRLQGIVPKLSGLTGTLYLDSFDENEDNNYITFQREDMRQHREVTGEQSVSDSETSVSADTVSGDEM